VLLTDSQLRHFHPMYTNARRFSQLVNVQRFTQRDALPGFLVFCFRSLARGSTDGGARAIVVLLRRGARTKRQRRPAWRQNALSPSNCSRSLLASHSPGSGACRLPSRLPVKTSPPLVGWHWRAGETVGRRTDDQRTTIRDAILTCARKPT